MNEFQIDFLSFDDLSQKIVKKLEISPPKERIKLTDYATLIDGFTTNSISDPSILDYICVLSKTSNENSNLEKSSLFAVFYNHELIIIDPFTKSILTKKSFLEESQSIEYFI